MVPRLPRSDDISHFSRAFRDLLMAVSTCQAAIRKTRTVLTHTYTVFIDEEVIGSHQCDPIIGSMDHLNELVGEVCKLLEMTASLPEPVIEYRYEILIALNQTEVLISKKVAPTITKFRDHCREGTIQESATQRLEIIDQLEELKQSLQESGNVLKRSFGKLVSQSKQNKALSRERSDESQPLIQLHDVLLAPLEAGHEDLFVPQDDTIAGIDISIDEPPAGLQSGVTMTDNNLSLLEPEHKPKVAVTKLREAMRKAYDLEDLEILCADLYPDYRFRYSDLKDGKLEVKIHRLIEHCQRDDKYEELVQIVLQKYPKLAREIN